MLSLDGVLDCPRRHRGPVLPRPSPAFLPPTRRPSLQNALFTEEKSATLFCTAHIVQIVKSRVIQRSLPCRLDWIVKMASNHRSFSPEVILFPAQNAQQTTTFWWTQKNFCDSCDQKQLSFFFFHLPPPCLFWYINSCVNRCSFLLNKKRYPWNFRKAGIIIEISSSKTSENHFFCVYACLLSRQLFIFTICSLIDYLSRRIPFPPPCKHVAEPSQWTDYVTSIRYGCYDTFWIYLNIDMSEKNWSRSVFCLFVCF